MLFWSITITFADRLKLITVDYSYSCEPFTINPNPNPFAARRGHMEILYVCRCPCVGHFQVPTSYNLNILVVSELNGVPKLKKNSKLNGYTLSTAMNNREYFGNSAR